MNQIEKNLRMYRFWEAFSEHLGAIAVIWVAVIIGVYITPKESLTNCIVALVAIPLLVLWFKIDIALHKKVKEYERLWFEQM